MKISSLQRELNNILNSIKDKELRRKVRELLREHEVIIGGRKWSGFKLSESPAGKSHHHSYKGGLLQHIVAVCKIAKCLCELLEKHYGGKVNRDIVLAACLLHDLRKSVVYTQGPSGEYKLSPLGEQIDHLSLTIADLIRKDMPLELIHAVAAHHGEYSPILPKSVEALIVHIADLADAQLNGRILDGARYIIRDCTGEDTKQLDIALALAVIKAKKEKGCEGVKELLSSLKLG